jgi:hypothetical protein
VNAYIIAAAGKKQGERSVFSNKMADVPVMPVPLLAPLLPNYENLEP